MGDLTSLAKATAAVTWTALTLRLRGFAPVGAECLHEPAADSETTAEAARRLARQYSRTALLPWSSCLTRSVALCRSLRRRGLPAVLRIGAEVGGASLRAHAWVEMNGGVINDRPTIGGDFVPLARPARSYPP